MDQPIYEFHRKDGHVFRIWACGKCEGFGEGVVFNRIPAWGNERVAKAIAQSDPLSTVIPS